MSRLRHGYIENTLASMQASFAAGATAVEIDVHPTADGDFAVFHDDMLDCRTDGSGITRAQSMDQLRTLDVGYGYTADDGETFPFRGKGVGLMKSLHEVLRAFPDKTIHIDLKGNDPADADQLVEYLRSNGHPTDERLWAWVDGRAYDRLKEIAPRAHVVSAARAKTCMIEYVATGWTGYVPEACRKAHVIVPSNLRWLYWGWPNRFLARMSSVDAEVLLTGPYGERDRGLSNVSALDGVPAGFGGLIVTDRIEEIGPEVRKRWGRSS